MLMQNSRIVFNKKVAAATFFMALKSPDIAAEALPGQFVMIRVENGLDPLLRRPFSLCGVHEDGRIFLLYRVVGKGTSLLSQRNSGESLSVLGPLGKGFRGPVNGEQALLVAGGMGMAPLVFLAEKIKASLFGFFAGFRSSSDLVPFAALEMGDVQVSIATEDGSAGHHGLVTDLLEAGLLRLSDALPKIYTCGPLPMLKAVSSIAAKKGIPCQVSLESSMACGLGACQGCAVKMKRDHGTRYEHVCQDGPVFDAVKVGWEVL